jgi:predicted ester cyclase
VAGRTNAEAMEMLIDGHKTSEGFMSVCDLFSDDVVMTQDIMFPGKSLRGREEMEGLWREIDEGFDNYRLPIHETVREDDKIVLFGHFEGNFTGDQYGVSGGGRPIRWEFRDAYYFKNGEIVKMDWVNDTLTVAVMTGLLEKDPRPAGE